MTADAQGNDLTQVKQVLTSKIRLAPYDPSKTLTAAMIAATVKDPATTLSTVFTADARYVGLITSDGAPQDARDSDDAIEFHQPGYSINADPSLTVAFTVAEDNDLTRELTIGTPDEDGVYHVQDTIQNTKWFAYQETVYKNGRIRRRLGVIQITGNEPAQDTRGEVSGLALTATWQIDATVDEGNSRYLQSYYDPTSAPAAKPVQSIAITPATVSVQAGEDAQLTVAFTPTDATDQTYTVASDQSGIATAAIKKDAPLTVTVHGVTAGTANVTVTANDGEKTATTAVTVTAKQ